DDAGAAFRQFLFVIEHVEGCPQVSACVAIVDETHRLIGGTSDIIGKVGDKVDTVVTNVLSHRTSHHQRDGQHGKQHSKLFHCFDPPFLSRRTLGGVQPCGAGENCSPA